VADSGGAALADTSGGGVLLSVTPALGDGDEVVADVLAPVAPQPASSTDAATSVLIAVRIVVGR